MASSDVQRKLTAILVTDVVGYSRLMGDDPEGTLVTLTEFRKVFSHKIQEYKGRVVNAPGDSLLADFTSVLDAVSCAVEIQRELAERNQELSDERRMDFRIGVNLGDVLVKDGDIYGDGVNVAARLESLAEPGGILISDKAYEEVKNRLPLHFEFMGEQSVKNIKAPVKAYQVLSKPGDAAHRVVQAKQQAAAGEAPPLPDKPSIAVLAFENMSGDPEQGYFSDGLAEDIITDLSKISGLLVIARTSSFSYKGRNVPVAQIGREMGVRHVLEGSVRKSGNRVRITAQLIEAGSGLHLWANRYDRKLEDFFDLQDEITQEIVTELDVKMVTGEQARVWRKSLKNPEARDLYYRGSEFNSMLNSKEGMKQAREMFLRVIKLEPDSPLGYASASATHWYEMFRVWSKDRDRSMQIAFELTQKALALDDSCAEGHVQLGMMLLYKRQHEQAIVEGERAAALSPNSANIAIWTGTIYILSNRPEEAINCLKRAIRLSPVPQSLIIHLLGVCHRLSARNEEAIASYRGVLALDAEFFTSRMAMVPCLCSIGRYEEAREEAEEIYRLEPQVSFENWFKSLPYKDPATNEQYLEDLRNGKLI